MSMILVETPVVNHWFEDFAWEPSPDPEPAPGFDEAEEPDDSYFDMMAEESLAQDRLERGCLL